MERWGSERPNSIGGFGYSKRQTVFGSCNPSWSDIRPLDRSTGTDFRTIALTVLRKTCSATMRAITSLRMKLIRSRSVSVEESLTSLGTIARAYLNDVTRLDSLQIQVPNCNPLK